MTHRFRYATPDWVYSGAGSLDELPSAIAWLHSKRVFVLTTRSLEAAVGDVEQRIGAAHVGTFSGCGQHSPAGTVAAAVAEADGCDALVSFGGGSVIDTAKAVAHQLGSPPHIAIPTTLSAGEFTAAAGITDEATRVKGLIAKRNLLPRVVIHDPQLTARTPRQLWLSTGIKALDHALEGLWARRPHPVTNLTALDAAARLLHWLPLSAEPDAMEAREECQLGAWLSIIGMTSAGTRLSHPIGHQIGAFWNVPHGITSCVTLPTVMRALSPCTDAVRNEVAPLFGVDSANDAADALSAMLTELELPQRLRDTEAVRAEIPQVASAVVDEFRHLGREPEVDIEALLQQMW